LWAVPVPSISVRRLLLARTKVKNVNMTFAQAVRRFKNHLDIYNEEEHRTRGLGILK
jgi:hypothetical protein